MKNKDVYTQVFLKAAEEEFNEEIINSKKSIWWWSTRNKDSGGLRLTEEGINYIIEKSDLKTYKIKFPNEITITPQILVWLDNFIESPYYITKKDITVIAEKAAFELYLFSGDIRKLGYGKALRKRMNQD
jgi:hypothetical protein